MDDISKTVESLQQRLGELEKKREASISASRSVIRMTKKIIHSIHTGEDFSKDMAECKAGTEKMMNDLKNEPELINSGPVADAMAEYAEACILEAMVFEKNIPDYYQLKITPQSWAMGMADCLGELRRVVLTHLMNNDTKFAKKIFDDMEVLCDHILSFDVPDSILPIRRKQDVARSVMEKTRTDVTNALMMKK